MRHMIQTLQVVNQILGCDWKEPSMKITRGEGGKGLCRMGVTAPLKLMSKRIWSFVHLISEFIYKFYFLPAMVCILFNCNTKLCFYMSYLWSGFEPICWQNSFFSSFVSLLVFILFIETYRPFTWNISMTCSALHLPLPYVLVTTL